jgi:hypothetical protein
MLSLGPRTWHLHWESRIKFTVILCIRPYSLIFETKYHFNDHCYYLGVLWNLGTGIRIQNIHPSKGSTAKIGPWPPPLRFLNHTELYTR